MRELSRNYAGKFNQKICIYFRRKLTNQKREKQKRESWNLKNRKWKNIALEIGNGKTKT
ncbi:hypothetical protein RCH33_2152 [Flavobacterium daejeonense]|nr:hypothetical protein RCH33_2152 [Flavobacterium daejeonense]